MSKESENKCVQIDWEKECEILRFQNKELRRENGRYKKALLNICLNVGGK